MTTLYQSIVTGKKQKPSIGHRRDSKTPENQLVKNQRTAIRIRGNASAMRATRQGMMRDFSFNKSTVKENNYKENRLIADIRSTIDDFYFLCSATNYTN